MGKKKSFIDKKNSKTYTLVFRSTDDKDGNEEDSDGALVPAEGSTGAAAAAAAANRDDPPTRDPRELFAHFFGDDDEDEHKENIPEARRKEMLEYGFPDDGYDYLRHCRVLGRGTSSLQHHAGPAAASQQQQQPQQDAACTSSSAANDVSAVEPAAAGSGPSVFVRAPRMQAPTADVKLVDARQVHVAGIHSLSESGVHGRDLSSGRKQPGSGTHAGEGFVSAAARTVQVESEAAAPAAARKLGGRELAEELLELEQMLDAAEAASDSEAAGGEQGIGDLLDDFVLEAAAGTDSDVEVHQQHQRHHTQPGLSGGAAAAAAGYGSQGLSETSDMQEHSSDLSDATPVQKQKQQQQTGPSMRCDGSQGASYSLLNEQFDSLLCGYDDDDLGDLEGDSRAAGHMQTKQLAAMVGVDVDSGDAGCEGHSEHEDDDAYEEDDYFPSGSDDDIPEELAALVAARAAAGQKRGVAKKQKQRSPLFEPKVASLDEHDEAVIAAVKARIKAQEEAADTAAGAASTRNGTGLLEDAEVQTVYLPSARERWDCESVLSLRSNVSHYPARIASEAARSRQTIVAADPGSSAAGAGGVIKLNSKTGMPVGYSSAGMMAAAAAAASASAAGGPGADSSSGAQTRLTQAAVAAAAAASGDGDGNVPGYAPSTATSIFERPKHETAEERKARKAAVKDIQREARAVKKQLKQMYAQEAGKQQRQQAGASKGTVYAIL